MKIPYKQSKETQLKPTLFHVEEVAKFILDNKIHLNHFQPLLFAGDVFNHDAPESVSAVQKFAEVVQNYYLIYKTYPTSDDRDQLARFIQEEPKHTDLTLQQLDNILWTPIDGLDYVLLSKYTNSILKMKVIARDLWVSVVRAKTANEGDILAQAQEMTKLFLETKIPDEKETSAADFSHWCLELLPEDDSLQREFLKMDPEWSVFNEHLYNDESKSGPWEKGQMTLFVLGTGEGKSTLCCNIGGSLCKAGYHVAIIGTEGSILSLFQKVYTPMYDITKSRWASLTKQEKIQKWTHFQNDVSRTTTILQPKIFFAGSGNKFNDTLQQIKDVEKQVGIPFDAVFFDYPDEMDPTKSSDQDWINKRQIYKEIQKAAEDNNWHVFIPQQYNRTGLQNTSPTMADLAGSIDSAKKASNVFLCHTWKEPMTEELKTVMTVGKYRPNGSLKNTTFTLVYSPATDKLTPVSVEI
jgi:hypothetical protein